MQGSIQAKPTCKSISHMSNIATKLIFFEINDFTLQPIMLMQNNMYLEMIDEIVPLISA